MSCSFPNFNPIIRAINSINYYINGRLEDKSDNINAVQNIKYIGNSAEGIYL